jgi:hypothetical protein
MRKADAWIDPDALAHLRDEYPMVNANLTRDMGGMGENDNIEPLWRRTPEDRHTLLDAADFLEDLVMDEDDEADVLVKRLREMAGS